MNRKGFSLVEILAVIIILAIIALIAFPVITGIMASSRESSYKSSVDNLYKAMEMYYTGDLAFSDSATFTYDGSRLTHVEKKEEVPVTGSMGSDSIGWGFASRAEMKFSVYKNNKCYYKINGSKATVKETTEEECKNIKQE